MNGTASIKLRPASTTEINGYSDSRSQLNVNYGYRSSAVLQQTDRRDNSDHVFDLDCGNGVVLDQLNVRGWAVVGDNPSRTETADAKARRSHLELHQTSFYDDIASNMDRNYTALGDHGHIKLWSIDTLGNLLTDGVFVDLSCERVGPILILAKSVVTSRARPLA